MTGGTLLVSRAVNLHGYYKKQLEVLGFTNVTVTAADKNGLNMVINDLKPQLVLIGCNFYKCSTPYMMNLLLHDFPDLNIAAISLSYYPADLAMYFIINGVNSCVSLYDGIEQFYHGLDRIRGGKTFVSASIQERIALRREIPKPTVQMTDSQLEIIKLVCNGLTALEICDNLCISERTVYNHKAAIYTNLNVRNENELIRIAINLGFVNPDEFVFYGNDYVLKPLPAKQSNIRRMG